MKGPFPSFGMETGSYKDQTRITGLEFQFSTSFTSGEGRGGQKLCAVNLINLACVMKLKLQTKAVSGSESLWIGEYIYVPGEWYTPAAWDRSSCTQAFPDPSRCITSSSGYSCRPFMVNQ